MTMIVYPLYMKNGFVHLATAKKEYFYIASCCLLIPSLVLSVWIYLFENDRKVKTVKPISTDWFVLAYALVLAISTCGSSYQDTALSGYSGWYMGLTTQLLFLIVYFCISRAYDFEKDWLFMLFTASFVVFILCVFARFHVAPFNLYSGRDEDFWNEFIPTLGQKNWYACFLIIIYPIELAYFLIRKKEKEDTFLIPLLVVSTMAAVMQDSDSVYVAMLFVLLFLFVMFVHNLKEITRYFSMLSIIFISMQVLGVIQIIFEENMVELSDMVTLCQGTLMRAACVAVVLIWIMLLLISHAKNTGKITLSDEKTERFIYVFKRVLLVLAALTIITLIVLIVLVTNFSDTYDFGWMEDSKYFMFDDYWGTWRGMNWTASVKAYGGFNFWQKLFGVGPDCFYPYMNANFPEFTARWSSAICNAHNEFLTALIDVGLVGAVCYYGIFVSLIWMTKKHWKEKPMLLVLCTGVIGFFFNNMFSFMNIISTPLLFCICGCMASIIRNDALPDEGEGDGSKKEPKKSKDVKSQVNGKKRGKRR